MFALTPRRKSMRAPLARRLGLMSEEFPALVNRLFNEWPVLEPLEWPAAWGVTTEEKEKEVVVRMEMPGFEPNEVNLTVTGGRLTVEAEHKEPEKKGERAEEKAERTYAHVKHMMTLPPETEPEKAEAILRNGLLEVHVPRKPEAVGRRIEVK